MHRHELYLERATTKRVDATTDLVLVAITSGAPTYGGASSLKGDMVQERLHVRKLTCGAGKLVKVL